ncbi:glycosyltransferase [Candidatus Saccharibacteria bacterium]|nr:glycosyltransferase [Candidatus Saccharibacteria bacterium]
MRIAIFTDVFLDVPGGIPSSIKAQRASLEKLGHEVTIFCPGLSIPKGEKNIELVPTHKHLRANGAPLSKSPELVEKWVREKYPMFGFDLVHVHYEASCSLAGARLAKLYKVPLVQTMHGREDMAIAINVPHPFKTIAALLLNKLHSVYIPHKKMVPYDNDLAPTVARARMWTLMVNHANFADQVITPSQHFANKLKQYGVEKPITVVSNGVADEMVKKLGSSESKLVRKMRAGDTLKIFWNSRISREKRIIPFLQAMAIMKEPCELTACGDGNALEVARRYAKRHKIKATFYGRVPHEKMLDKMLSQHISATVSYGFDTQGLTLLEAEVTGMPVFFCDPDMKESVPKGGFIMSDGPDVKSMAKALDALSCRPEKIEEMSRVMLKNRENVLQSTQIKKLIQVYQTALNHNR